MSQSEVQQKEDKMSNSRLLHLHSNQIGVTNGKHLSSDARVRVGGGCFVSGRGRYPQTRILALCWN